MPGQLTTLIPATLGLFIITLGLFGGMSYGAFYFMGEHNTWAATGFFVGLIAMLFVMVSALKNFFQKFTSRIIFAMWLIALLGSYAFYLFERSAYPMGIDLAGGSELVYVLDYTAANRNIDSAYRVLQEEQGKDPNSQKTIEARSLYETLVSAKDSAADKAAEVVRKRVDPSGTKGIPVTTLGTDKQRLRIQLPKATTEEVNRVKEAIRTQGRLTFHIVTNEQSALDALRGKPGGTSYVDPSTKIEYVVKEIIEKGEVSGEEKKQPIIVKQIPDMDGSQVIWAGAERNPKSQYHQISVRFSSQGGVEFNRLTSSNIHKQMAVVLDGVAHTAPTIQEAISNQCQISGNFTGPRAEQLAGILTAGSLPAEVVLDSDYTVGPTLGREQIRSGMVATIIAAVLVIGFILWYYRLAGAIAAFCTVLNTILLLGAMGFFKATLTLPGIAGIVLTLGMSVDANVLILERIREELGRGRSLRLAIGHGFDRAFLTIIDCHVTTIISGMVLYYLGTGPVRGFAVTLTIGIIATLFTNLWLNWIIMEWLVTRDALANLNMMEMFKTPRFDFMKYRKPALIFTGATAALSAILFLATPDQRKYDVDFTGGTLLQFNFRPGSAKDEQQVRDIVERDVRSKVAGKADEVKGKLKAEQQDLKTKLAALKSGGNAAMTEVNSMETRIEGYEDRIQHVEQSMKNFDLVTQGFNKPETANNYRRFTVTTRITEPQLIEAVDVAIVQVFGKDLEPPAIELAKGADNKVESILVRFEPTATPNTDKVRSELKSKALKASTERTNEAIAADLAGLTINKVESKDGYVVAEVKAPSTDSDPNRAEKVAKAIEVLKLDNRAEGAISRKNGFGAQVAGDMKWQALAALILANLGVGAYLWFRFEFSGAWGFGAIVALVHDVLIAVGAVMIAIWLGFPILINLNIVAALLSIIGFSVNDTIVTFDRIREVKAAHPTRSYEEIVNEAVNETLGRTVLTTLTVMLATVSLLIFGGPTIKDLAFTLLVGFIAGVYSSVFIAAPLMIWWYRTFGGGKPMADSASTKPAKTTATPEPQV